MMFTVYQKLIWYQENRDRSSGKEQNWLITVYHRSVSVYIGFYCTFYRKKDLIFCLNKKIINIFQIRKKTPNSLDSFSVIKFWPWEFTSAYLERVKRHRFLLMELYWKQRFLFSTNCIFVFTSSTCVLNILVIVFSIRHGRHPTTGPLSLTGWMMKQSLVETLTNQTQISLMT